MLRSFNNGLFTYNTMQSDKISLKQYYHFLIIALKGKEQDFTNISLRRAIFMLAIPMILEMPMEPVFA